MGSSSSHCGLEGQQLLHPICSSSSLSPGSYQAINILKEEKKGEMMSVKLALRKEALS